MFSKKPQHIIINTKSKYPSPPPDATKMCVAHMLVLTRRNSPTLAKQAQTVPKSGNTGRTTNQLFVFSLKKTTNQFVYS